MKTQIVAHSIIIIITYSIIYFPNEQQFKDTENIFNESAESVVLVSFGSVMEVGIGEQIADAKEKALLKAVKIYH